MREIESGKVIVLAEKNNIAHHKRIKILKCLGMGSSSVAYEVIDDNEIHYVLKECIPMKTAQRDSNGIDVIWKETRAKKCALQRFKKAYNVQINIQSNADTENSSAKLYNSIYIGNNTEYTLSSHYNAQTYDNELYRKETIYNIALTARAVAKTIKGYHKLGYLHLDIKPQNIMIIPETRDLVLLIDFDSVVEEKEIDTSALSYSPAFSAPEQKAGLISKIGESTDIYGIGALIYNKLFNSYPSAIDTTSYSNWDFNLEGFKGVDPAAKRKVQLILRKTLNADPASRYSNVDALICVLNELVEISSPVHKYLLSTNYSPWTTVIGRDMEVGQIYNAFKQNNVVVLRGVGGIGKTELARKYAETYNNEYDTICFGKYTDSLERLFADEAFISIANGINNTNMVNSVRQFVNERTLLIIDNFDSFDDKDLNHLFALSDSGCRLLITSRNDIKNTIKSNINQIEITELSDNKAIELFLSEVGEKRDRCDTNIVEKILSDVEKNTLLIVMIARLFLKDPIHTLKEISDNIYSSSVKIRINKDGQQLDKINNVLKKVLDISYLTERQIYVLECMSLLSKYEINDGKFISWIGLEYIDELNDLVERNWIQKNANSISIHCYISQVCLSNIKKSIFSKPFVNNIMANYTSNVSKINQYIEEKHHFENRLKYIMKQSTNVGDNNNYWLQQENVSSLSYYYGIDEYYDYYDMVFTIDWYHYFKMLEQELLIESLLASADYNRKNDIKKIISFYFNVSNTDNYMYKGDRICLSNYINYLPAISAGKTIERIIDSNVFDELDFTYKFNALMLLLYQKMATLLDPFTYIIETIGVNGLIDFDQDVIDRLNNTHNVLEITRLIIEVSKKIEELVWQKNDSIMYYKRLLAPFDTISKVFSITAFTYDWSFSENINREALDEFNDYVLKLIEKANIKESRDKINKLQKEYKSIMTSEMLSTVTEFDPTIRISDEEWEEIEKQINDDTVIKYECVDFSNFSILHELGYINSNYDDYIVDAKKIAKNISNQEDALQILKDAKEEYEKGKMYQSSRYFWIAVLVYAIRSDIEKAGKEYACFLEKRWHEYGNVPKYHMELIFNDIDLLVKYEIAENIILSVKRIALDFVHNKISTITIDNDYIYYCTLIRLKSLAIDVGDNNLEKQYVEEISRLEDAGFSSKTDQFI